MPEQLIVSASQLPSSRAPVIHSAQASSDMQAICWASHELGPPSWPPPSPPPPPGSLNQVGEEVGVDVGETVMKLPGVGEGPLPPPPPPPPRPPSPSPPRPPPPSLRPWMKDVVRRGVWDIGRVDGFFRRRVLRQYADAYRRSASTMQRGGCRRNPFEKQVSDPAI